MKARMISYFRLVRPRTAELATLERHRQGSQVYVINVVIFEWIFFILTHTSTTIKA